MSWFLSALKVCNLKVILLFQVYSSLCWEKLVKSRKCAIVLPLLNSSWYCVKQMFYEFFLNRNCFTNFQHICLQSSRILQYFARPLLQEIQSPNISITKISLLIFFHRKEGTLANDTPADLHKYLRVIELYTNSKSHYNFLMHPLYYKMLLSPNWNSQRLICFYVVHQIL